MAGVVVVLVSLGFGPASAQQVSNIEIPYLSLVVKRTIPQAFLDQPAADEGVQGARLAIADNQTTGKFVNQDFHLNEALEPDEASVIAAFEKFVAGGAKFVVTDVTPPVLLKLADLPEAKGVTLLDATSIDDALRGENCRANFLHLLPSRAMMADALMQYLVVKNWRHILLVIGKAPLDKLWGDAFRHSAQKFNLSIEEKPWTYVGGSQRSDTGHYEISAEVARFTQGISYDVLVVADQIGRFGYLLPYHTTDPRPVVGTQGLVPSAWARPFEQWGATQLQNRFHDQTQRWMTDRDYGAWMAVRAVGEAATRSGSADPAAIAAYLHGDTFELAAYKGARLSFRPWDGQLRQPILLADTQALVSVSPQPGFLHQFFELDTLGTDQPETTCHLQ